MAAVLEVLRLHCTMPTTQKTQVMSVVLITDTRQPIVIPGLILHRRAEVAAPAVLVVHPVPVAAGRDQDPFVLQDQCQDLLLPLEITPHQWVLYQVRVIRDL